MHLLTLAGYWELIKPTLEGALRTPFWFPPSQPPWEEGLARQEEPQMGAEVGVGRHPKA